MSAGNLCQEDGGYVMTAGLKNAERRGEYRRNSDGHGWLKTCSRNVLNVPLRRVT